MGDKLTDRLRGKYKVGPEGLYGTRDFSGFIPPICNEAVERIESLEAMLSKKLDLIRCGIGSNYSGDPFENKLYTEVSDLLANT